MWTVRRISPSSITGPNLYMNEIFKNDKIYVQFKILEEPSGFTAELTVAPKPIRIDTLDITTARHSSLRQAKRFLYAKFKHEVVPKYKNLL